MPNQAVFAGLIFDEMDNPAEVVFVGDEPCYVVDDAGFRRHIPSEQVDRQVLGWMGEMIEGHEELVSEQTAKMLGQDDPFSVAAITAQLKNIDQQFDQLLRTGLPEEVRAYLGMMGFRIRINVHGEVLDVEQPGMVADEDE
ncbi:MAG: hypothetical protein JXA78_19855 [Anaerolineales bacterium]|nr:hypothetical protein [Anaerolineales bacterium]